MRVLLLETQSSLRAICHSLQWKNYMSDSETAYLYRTLTHETFEEFRFFHYKTERLPEEEEGLYDDGSACPACPKKNDSIFVSLDANFGLVRKKNAGTSLEPPKHASKFFINQEEVDDYVDQYSTQTSSKEEHQECNSFQATSVIRTKNKTANLDATGVFGSACRHGVPRLFLSMRHGERYAYPALLLKKLLTGSTLHHHVIYDIACKFDTHIKVAYSTRWRKDYGLTDGEGMERLWSYLRKCVHITKEMTPSHRIDLLSDALRHFAMGKVCNQAASLCLCLQKCRDVAQKSNSEIQEICREFKTTVDDIKRWREEDKCAISKKKSSGSKCVQYHKTLEALEFTKASPIQSGWSHDYNLHLYNLVLKVHVNPFYFICPQMGSICVLFRSLVSTFYRQFVNVL
ncbi:uncharacterized protein [Apostichopus japonicus]|uniref:uncharacterized protein n=1 Tax=Stichopus japonicus TaxID=307972 RepID=UPI003AB5AA0D